MLLFRGKLIGVEEDIFDGQSRGYSAVFANRFESPDSGEVFVEQKSIRLAKGDEVLAKARNWVGKVVTLSFKSEANLSKHGKAYLYDHSGRIAEFTSAK